MKIFNIQKSHLKGIIVNLLYFVFITGTLHSIAQDSKTQYDFNKLDKYFEQSMQQWQIPGMSVAIVKDTNILFIKGYGVRNIQKTDKVDKNTIFGIASNSKAFTAASIMILSEEGKLALNDHVTDYLPYFQLYDSCATKEITIRDLLCHRSGLGTFSGDLIWYASNYNRKNVIERIRYVKPKYSFRSKFGYSNLMFLVAGEVVEAVSGITWDNFVKQNIFLPIGMINSNTSILQEKNIENRAIPHTTVDDKIIALDFVNWDNMAPAGGINSNASDMSKWLITQLNSGTYRNKSIFNKNSSKQMWTPNTINTTSTFDSTMHFNAYGLGWGLFDYHGYKIVNHSGGLDGMISHVALIPDKKIGFVVLTNSNSYLPTALMYEVVDFFLGIKDRDWSTKFLNFAKNYENREKEIRKKDAEERIKNTKPTLKLENYTGLYGGNIYGNVRILLNNNNQLEIKFIPTPLFDAVLHHWQNDTFELVFKDCPSLPHGKIHFILGNDSKIRELKINVPNPDFDFTELVLKKIE